MGNMLKPQNKNFRQPVGNQDQMYPLQNQQPMMMHASNLAGPPIQGQAVNDYATGISNPGLAKYPNPLASTVANFSNPNSRKSSILLSNLTGWTMQDIERLKFEFSTYANRFGVMDREGFHKLYAASLLNTSWDIIQREADVAFRNFDINQSGNLDFDEYIAACIRMARDSTS